MRNIGSIGFVSIIEKLLRVYGFFRCFLLLGVCLLSLASAEPNTTNSSLYWGFAFRFLRKQHAPRWRVAGWGGGLGGLACSSGSRD